MFFSPFLKQKKGKPVFNMVLQDANMHSDTLVDGVQVRRKHQISPFPAQTHNTCVPRTKLEVKLSLPESSAEHDATGCTFSSNAVVHVVQVVHDAKSVVVRLLKLCRWCRMQNSCAGHAQCSYLI
jgi:hypothetical protein